MYKGKDHIRPITLLSIPGKVFAPCQTLRPHQL